MPLSKGNQLIVYVLCPLERGRNRIVSILTPLRRGENWIVSVLTPLGRGKIEVVPACIGMDFQGVTVLQISVVRRKRWIPAESVCRPELNAIRRL